MISWLNGAEWSMEYGLWSMEYGAKKKALARQSWWPKTTPWFQNGSKMEVAIMEVAAEVMEVLIALKQIARMVISSFSPGKSKNLNSKNVFQS